MQFKKILPRTGKVVLFLVVVFAVAELGLRFCFWVALSPADRAAVEFAQMMRTRIHSYWVRPGTQNLFEPPFLVYANADWNNPARLEMVFQATRLPPSQTWKSHDFLQHPDRANETIYSIRSNSLGFRGPEYLAQKPPGTYRIIALGSYHTFGHGVEDDQTYAARLEAILNQKFKTKKIKKFEVWNGGRHAGTAIIGLARMKKEIFNYKPDLLVLDYGMVDSATLSDNFFPKAMRFPDGPVFNFFKKFFEPLVPILGESHLIARMKIRLLDAPDAQLARRFQGIMKEMLTVAEAHHVPVVLVKQLPTQTIPAEFYAPRNNDHVSLIKVNEVFMHSSITEQELSQFFAKPNWLNEIPRETWQNNGRFGFYWYRLDYYQLNQLGHQKLAEALAAKIQPRIAAFNRR